MSADQSPMAYFPGIRTLADVPSFHARRTPDNPAFYFEGRRTNYTEFDRHTASVANGLIAAGVSPESHVGYLGKNSDHYFEILYGAIRAGAVLTPVNCRLAPPEIVFIANDAAVEVLFVDDSLAAMVQEIQDQLSTVKLIVAMSTVANCEWPAYTLWRDQQPSRDPGVAVTSEMVALQLYTSGTTGRPKGAQLTHRNFLYYNEYQIEHPESVSDDLSWNYWNTEDVSLVTMPVFHASGSAWGIISLYAGAFSVVLSEFDAGAVLDCINDFRVTKTVLVPTTIQLLLDHPRAADTDFSCITDLLYGASPIPLALLERAVEVMQCGFVQVYGLTETCGAFTYLPRGDHQIGNPRMRSAGKALPGAEVAIMPAGEDRLLPPGEEGEICVRTGATMKGYWNLPEESLRVIGPDGWFRSGDAGRQDADGYVYISDRIKDMIVTGGENVYPAEVESAIYDHPAVVECAVIGVPDEKWGEAVKAFVVPKPNQALNSDELIAFLRENIAGYKVPKSVEFIEAVPRNASGKPMKNELRKPYWEGRQRQVN